MTSSMPDDRDGALWRPTDPNNSMDTFRRWVEKEETASFPTYADLYAFSIAHISRFWSLIWQYTGVIASRPYTSVVDEPAPMQSIPEWFPGARLNWAENMLRCRSKEKTALIEMVEPPAGEPLVYKRVSYADLYSRVSRFSSALRVHGVLPGDVVAAYGPNCLETAVACLSAACLGALWSSTAAEFGPSGVLDRFLQVPPKVLVSCNAVRYNRKVHPHQAKLLEVVEGLRKEVAPGMITVVINYVDGIEVEKPAGMGIIGWDEFERRGADIQEVEFYQAPFDWPLWVLFSSGTTGKPKAIVHRAGGMLLQSQKEHVIHGGMTENDVFFQYTNPGWMMYNYLLSGLSTSATIVLFDGSPLYDPPLLWRMAEDLGVTIFGTSAKYLDVLSQKYTPGRHHDLSRLKQILSTGSPLKGDLYDWVYKNVAQDLILGSITGGTDICSLFAGHNTGLPVYRGEIQCLNLGMAVEPWSDDGSRVPAGTPGDLACVKAFPCMPVQFWNDPGHKRYKAAYFERFRGVWHHGDYVVVTPSRAGNGGGLVMQGRSDGVLNPQGVRFGSAEIYECIEELGDPTIEESLVVGQPTADGTDERVILFLQLRPGSPRLDDSMVKRLKTYIRSRRSPRHVPEVILQVSGIPLTINNKKVEIPVKKLLAGAPLSSLNPATLRNPECLEEFVRIRAQLGVPP